MKLFKKNENKKTTKLPMTGKVKKSFRYYCMAVMAMTFVLGTSVTAFAANDPIQVVNNLSDFIFGLVRAVGMIMLGFGIVQISLFGLDRKLLHRLLRNAGTCDEVQQNEIGRASCRERV